MPDKNGRLSKEDVEKVIKWFKKHWTQPAKCDVCGKFEWTIGKTIIAPMNIVNSEVKITGQLYPQILVLCKHCGNTKYFNAIIMGLVEKNEEVTTKVEE